MVRTYVCDTQSSQIVPLELAPHSLPARSTGGALAQMRRHIRASTHTQTPRARCLSSNLAHIRRRVASLFRSLGCHGVLERTLCSEMVTTANTTLDLHLLERLGLLVLFRCLLLLLSRLETDLRAENNVLTQSRSVHARSSGFACLGAHFRPVPTLGHAGILFLLYDSAADSLGAAHFFAFFVEEDRYHCFGAVFVAGDLGRRDAGREIGLLIFGPVGATGGILDVGCHGCGLRVVVSVVGGSEVVSLVVEACEVELLRSQDLLNLSIRVSRASRDPTRG